MKKTESKEERKEMIEKEFILREEKMLQKIWDLEEIFLENPANTSAIQLINEWNNLIYFKYKNKLPRAISRVGPLYDFLKADNYYFSFRRNRRKREALELLKRIRHDG